jgi:vitamin B12 transporter
MFFPRSRPATFKQWVPMLAIGMGYQFDVPATSFFQSAPSKEEVTAQELNEKENIHPVDALKTLPGIVLLGSEITTYPGSFFLRGANADHTLFVWNDLRADDFTSPNAATDPYAVGSEFSSRIRVLKGPQSLLYGTQALGGVVLIDDDDADADSFVGAAVGSVHSAKLTTELRARQGTTRLALGGSGLSTEGLSAANAETPRGPNQTLETDGQQHSSVTGIASVELDRDEQLQLLWNASRGVANDDVPPLDDVNAQTERRGQQWKLRYRKSYGERFDSTWLVTRQEGSRDSRNPPDAFNPDHYADLARGERVGLLNRSAWRGAQSLWHFGAEFLRDRGEFTSQSSFAPLTRVTAVREDESAYVVNDWNFARSDVSWGVRGNCQDGRACVGVYQVSYQFHWPTEQRSLYAIVSSGLKRPTLYELDSSYGSADLKAETSRATEIGWLQSWGPDHRVKLSLFQNDFSNLIDYDFASSRYQNLNKASTRGVEFLHQYRTSSSVTESAGLPAGWDSELSLAVISARDEGRGQRLLRRPTYQSAWSLGYGFRPSFRAAAEWIYLGDREDVDAQGARLLLGATSVLNTVLTYQPERRSQFFLRVNNVANTFYEDIHGYLTAGRFYWAGCKISF